MAYDLVLEARAFLPTGFEDVEIGIDQSSGRIETVKRSLPPGTPRKRHRGRLVLPSATDLHVHFRDPGHPKNEDFRTGTIGAAKGGVSAVADMPNTTPPVDRPGRLEEKRERVAPKAAVDWGLWCTLTAATPDPQPLLRRSLGAKLFLAPTTGIPVPPSPKDLARWLGDARRAGRPVVVHAERPAPGQPSTLARHDALRPIEGEVAAIEALAKSAGGARVHVAHASGAPVVEAARRAGFSLAVTPHHLLLSLDEKNLGGRGKVNPPLRSSTVRKALWDAFIQGQVPVVESDHAPHTLPEKDGPFSEAPAGVPGVETGYPLLLRKAQVGDVPMGVVVAAYAQNPADFLGIRKGKIAPGYDADLVVMDPRTVRRVRADDLASPCGWSPFEGWEILPVESHYLRGELIVEGFEFVGSAGAGRSLETATTPPAQ